MDYNFDKTDHLACAVKNNKLLQIQIIDNIGYSFQMEVITFIISVTFKHKIQYIGYK